MGNSSSRRVTIVNEDTVGIVQISDSVVKRLKTNPDKEPEKSKAERAEPEKPAPRVVQQPIVQKMGPSPSESNFVSSLEQRQKFHEEFKEAKASWQKRIDDLEQKNNQLLKAAENRLAAEIVNVETNYMKQTFEPVCPDKQELVQKCYQQNLKRPLMCSQEVKAFAKCFEETRKSLITS